MCVLVFAGYVGYFASCVFYFVDRVRSFSERVYDLAVPFYPVGAAGRGLIVLPWQVRGSRKRLAVDQRRLAVDQRGLMEEGGRG